MEVVNKNINEFNVDVPWGHIAVKAWGEKSHPPILVVHGRMDNAGAYDGLIPLLPSSFYNICIDLPGHGRSSYFPPHLPIHTTDFLLVYKILMQHFGRKKYTIIGHSYGGQIGLLYARIYPHLINKLIMLDTAHTYPISIDSFKNYLVNAFERHMVIQQRMTSNRPPQYSYIEALQRLMNSRDYIPLTKKASEAILRRSLIEIGKDRYIFSLDQRMKNFIDPLHDFRYAVESLQKDPITVPTLILLAKNSQVQTQYMQPVIKVMEKCKNVSVRYIEGGHDVHNNNPQMVAPIVSEFLLGRRVKKHGDKSCIPSFVNILKKVKILK